MPESSPPSLPTRILGKTGVEVTSFGLGGEGVLRTHGRTGEAVAVIRRALDRGVTYYDSAPAYSGCLDYYGEALGERRKDVFFASKTHERSRDGSLHLLDETLRRLRTDYLDLWQLHDLRTTRDLDLIFAKGGALEALLQARDEGRVRYLGITGHHDPEILLEALRRFDFDTALVALNAADVHRLSFIQSVLPAAAERNMGVIAMKVYAQGGLLEGAGSQVGISPTEALGYALSLGGVSTAIIGCSTPDEVDDNVRIACEFQPLDDARLRELEQRTALIAQRGSYFKKAI